MFKIHFKSQILAVLWTLGPHCVYIVYMHGTVCINGCQWSEQSGWTESRSPLCITLLFIVWTNPRYVQNPLLPYSLQWGKERETEVLNKTRTVDNRSQDCFSLKREREREREIGICPVCLTTGNSGLLLRQQVCNFFLRAERRGKMCVFMCMCVKL